MSEQAKPYLERARRLRKRLAQGPEAVLMNRRIWPAWESEVDLMIAVEFEAVAREAK